MWCKLTRGVKAKRRKDNVRKTRARHINICSDTQANPTNYLSGQNVAWLNAKATGESVTASQV